MFTVVLLAGLIGLSACDVSSGPYPYPASPASAALPGEYGAPPLPNSQYGAPASPSSVQLSQENIQFGGQFVEVNNGRPNNVYLPPSSSSQFQPLKKPKKVCLLFRFVNVFRENTNNLITLFRFKAKQSSILTKTRSTKTVSCSIEYR